MSAAKKPDAKLQKPPAEDDGLVFVIHDEPEVIELDAFNNAARPPERRMRVHLRPSSFNAYRKAMSRAAQAAFKARANDAIQDDDVRIDDAVFQRELFMDQVVAVENIPVQSGGTTRDATPADLWDAHNAQLAIIAGEIHRHLRRMEAVDRKN